MFYVLEKPPASNTKLRDVRRPVSMISKMAATTKSVEHVRQFLNGDFDSLKSVLVDQMMAFSDELRFEDAARIRDQSNRLIKFFSDKMSPTVKRFLGTSLGLQPNRRGQ